MSADATPPPTNADGFLLDPGQWDRDVALWLAREQEGLDELTAEHWRVLDYVRAFWREHDRAPMVRYLCKSSRLKLKRVYELFPSGPADGACKLAGLPNADGCV